MNFPHRNGVLRASALSFFAFGLLLPGSASAAPAQPSTGTLTGTVTCGDAAITPAAYALVAPEGINIQSRTDNAGRFTLSNVPAGQNYTIDAEGDSGSSGTASRFNVVVRPGQTLDIGNVDIASCPSTNRTPVVEDDQLYPAADNFNN
jgi:hypothetical protein